MPKFQITKRQVVEEVFEVEAENLKSAMAEHAEGNSMLIGTEKNEFCVGCPSPGMAILSGARGATASLLGAMGYPHNVPAAPLPFPTHYSEIHQQSEPLTGEAIGDQREEVTKPDAGGSGITQPAPPWESESWRAGEIAPFDKVLAALTYTEQCLQLKDTSDAEVDRLWTSFRLNLAAVFDQSVTPEDYVTITRGPGGDNLVVSFSDAAKSSLDIRGTLPLQVTVGAR